ncbi:MAG: acyl-CoA thioesterase domain-containing protein, partial [Chakrabartia godavariana]
MTPLGQLIGSIVEADDGRFTVNASDDWRQGRTLYGGASAGLCYAACERLVPDLPPLRSAQIAFIGPSGGEATLVPTVLRRGKSVTFMACDLLADGVVATRTLFAFGGERESAFAVEAPAAPDVPPPEECPPLFRQWAPTFA